MIFFETVKSDIQACNNAKELLVQSMHNLVSLTQVQILNESINSEYPDYFPQEWDIDSTSLGG